MTINLCRPIWPNPKSLWLLVLSFFLTVPLFPAQSADTRTQVLKELRREKQSRIRTAEPEERPAVEKAFLYLEEKGLQELTTIRFYDFYPQFGSFTTTSGFGPGIRYYKADLGSQDLTLESSATLTLQEYRQLTLNFGRFNKIAPSLFLGPAEFGAPFEFGSLRPREVDRKQLLFYSNLRYRFMPREIFYGLGNDSQRSNRRDYLQEDFNADGVLGYQFNRWLAAGAALSYRKYNTEPGDDEGFPDLLPESPLEGTLPGLQRQPDFILAASGVFLNFTDEPANPHRGGALGFGFSRMDDRGGSDYEFNRISLDARGYLPLGSRQRVLAARVFSSQDRPDSGSQVPFFLKQTLGGSEMLRGYPPFRFRDDNLFYISAEYRWEPAPAFELALFYDTGRVYPDGESFAFEHFKKSIGFGLRVKTSRQVIMRFDIGRSEESTLLQFRFGPAF